MNNILLHKPIVQKLIEACETFDVFPKDIYDIFNNSNHFKSIKSKDERIKAETRIIRMIIYTKFRLEWEPDIRVKYTGLVIYKGKINGIIQKESYDIVFKELQEIGFKIEYNEDHIVVFWK